MATDSSKTQNAFRVDAVNGLTIEWDVPITVSDGNTLRADVFRPIEPGEYPVILSSGPYGKGAPFQLLLQPAWRAMVDEFPEVLEGTSAKYIVFELVDPEKWVPDGYVCVFVDSRGFGRSPGRADPCGPREIQDIYECIEWAASQPWSNGRVGMNGISYYGMNQWLVAAKQPPHLQAICVWEGATDWYRDVFRHGGILSTFMDSWFGNLMMYCQNGGGVGFRSPHTGQLISGDETLTREELAANHIDLAWDARVHPFLDQYFRDRTPDWSKIQVPLLSAGNWGGAGLHLRGSTLGYELAGSSEKWLEMHNGNHWSLFYANYGLDLQKRFFARYLKDAPKDWDEQPRVQLNVRHAEGHSELRTSTDWPLPETRWTHLYLDASNGILAPTEPGTAASGKYVAGMGRLSFTYEATERVELAGPVAARLYIESSTQDADLFVVIRAFSPDGTEIVYQGANDPHAPVAQGWLRASQRALDAKQSRPFLPVHVHDKAEPLSPGTIYELDLEILPTSLILPAGYKLTFDVQGHDYIYPHASGEMDPDYRIPLTGCGLFLHDDAYIRPPYIYRGDVTLHTGGAWQSYLLLPVIPNRLGHSAPRSAR